MQSLIINKRQTFNGFILTLALLLAACSGMQSTGSQKSLYERLGGKSAIQSVVDGFIGTVAADTRINGFLLNRYSSPEYDVGRTDFEASGGPCQYSGRSMLSAHQGMGVQESHFNALVEDLVKSLDKLNVPEREKMNCLLHWLP